LDITEEPGTGMHIEMMATDKPEKLEAQNSYHQRGNCFTSLATETL
jgi:hypothetical protein